MAVQRPARSRSTHVRHLMTTTTPTEGPQANDTAEVERLDDWSCFKVQQAQRTERSHHIVGSICHMVDGLEVREGRVTPAIVSIDLSKRTMTAEDGGAYKLGRFGGTTPDAMYVWRRWQRATQATQVIEVTVEADSALKRDPAQALGVPAPKPKK